MNQTETEKKTAYRIERDSMGPMRVPAGAMYGAQTARALENFPISDLRFPREFIKALGHIKKVAARVNGELGRLDSWWWTCSRPGPAQAPI